VSTWRASTHNDQVNADFLAFANDEKSANA